MAEMSGSSTDLVPSRAGLKDLSTRTDGPKVGWMVLPTCWEGYLAPSLAFWMRKGRYLAASLEPCSKLGSHLAGLKGIQKRKMALVHLRVLFLEMHILILERCYWLRCMEKCLPTHRENY